MEQGAPAGSETQPRGAGAPARLLAWAAATVLVGLACGGGAVLLSLACQAAEGASERTWWLAFCLPACSLLTCWAYHALGVSNDITTSSVFARARDGGPLRAQLAPAILAGTALTLLGGGSVGKEAAALQLGGALGAQAARVGKGRAWAGGLRDARETLVLAGMAAAFSALLFAPVAATLLVLEVARPARGRLLRWRTFCIPGAAGVAFALSSAFGVGRLWQAWAPGADQAAHAVPLGGLALLVTAAFACGVLFVWLLKTARRGAARVLPAPWARVLAGSCAAVALGLALGRAYAGTGDALIAQVLAGHGLPAGAFAGKAALTLACLGFGLKGGEVMPVMAVGACLGSCLGGVVGADPALFAALGLVAAFSTCTLCPATALALALEAFGAGDACLFAVAALAPGCAALALDVARLCRSRADVRAYVRDASGLAGRRGAFSLGLFVR